MRLFRDAGDPRAAARAMAPLRGSVLLRLGDPRGWEQPAEAVALLEPLEPCPELVGAVTELAAIEALQGRNEVAIDYAEQALALARVLGLPRPARALGFRGLARGGLGDRGGIADMREAIVLATAAGQGRDVGILHNNLSILLLAFEGPAACNETASAGISFARARGLTEAVDHLTAGQLETLVDMGEHEQALELAAPLAVRLEKSGDSFDLLSVRFTETMILTSRGHPEQIVGTLEWLEVTSRESGHPEAIVANLAAVAFAQTALANPERAAALLTEIDTTPDVRGSTSYAARLPLMLRIAITLGDLGLAQQLIDGVEARTPFHEHALTAATAALDEAHGNLQAAADGYADAAERWQTFGFLTEQAYAHLGRGRTLLGQGQPAKASGPLVQARDIFARLQAAPALAETDALLEQATALSS